MSHRDLFRLLADDTVINAVLGRDRSSMDEKTKQGVKQLYHHYVRPPQSNLATRFRNATKLEVPQKWKSYVRSHGADPTWIPSSQASESSQVAQTVQGGTKILVDVLFFRAMTTARMEVAAQPDALKNFHYLFFYDLIRQLFPKAKHTQRGLGPNIISELEKVTKPLEEPLTRALGFEWGAVALREWYDVGFGVNILVAKLGPGCLFVLGEHLSEDFLRKLPKFGSVHDEVVDELEGRLRLPQLLEETRLDELGTALRAHLVTSFSGHSIKDLVASR